VLLTGTVTLPPLPEPVLHVEPLHVATFSPSMNVVPASAICADTRSSIPSATPKNTRVQQTG